MRYAHLLSRLTSTPWFITEDGLQAIASLIEARLGGFRIEMPDAGTGSGDNPAPSYATVPTGGIALVEASGIFGKRLGMLEQSCGGCDYDAVVNAVASAAADPNVSRIVLVMNSRGGTANGAPEAYAQLKEIKASSGKPMIGYVDTIGCSAGYYLLAVCDAIFCTSTARLGSIASMLQLVDTSEADAKQGVKRYVIKSGTMKDIGNPSRPATPEELKILNAENDYLGGLFMRDMQSARPQIAAEVFETGLAYFGPEAVRLGLADKLVGSLEDVVASLSAAPI